MITLSIQLRALTLPFLLRPTLSIPIPLVPSDRDRNKGPGGQRVVGNKKENNNKKAKTAGAGDKGLLMSKKGESNY